MKEFCPHCRKEYEAQKSIKVFGIQLYQSYGCNEQLKLEEARRKLKYAKSTQAR